MGPVLSAAGLLVSVLLVLAVAWLFTRWAGKNLGGGFAGLGGSGRIEVLDRTNLDRDRSILLVRAGRRYLLLGSTPGGVTLRELEASRILRRAGAEAGIPCPAAAAEREKID